MRKMWGWLLAACLVCMPFSRAYAVDWSSNAVTLEGNTEVDSSIVISGEKTLDLNGYELKYTGSGSLFIIGSGGQLTIKDSASDTNAEFNESVVSAANGTQTTSYDSSERKLTWYETRSAISADGYHTTETLYMCTASGLGCIIAGESDSSLIHVSGGGDLIIEDGAIFGAKNHAVLLEGGGTVMTMSGGYLLGNEASRGGAVLASDADLNMTGGVMSGNTATGANSDEGGEHYGGGAVCLVGSSVFRMTGGMLTNNKATSTSYFDGGGAVLVNGSAEFIMGDEEGDVSLTATDIQITGNEAASGGGVRTGWQQRATFKMYEGIVAGNVANLSEGGGVSVNMQGVGYVYKGYVTNNKTQTTQHWGGGGLFCSDGSSLIMNGTLIAENTAGGFGGGVGGCSTGRIDTVDMSITDYGAAIFDNYAQGTNLSGKESSKTADHLYADQSAVFRENGYQDFFCALSSYVADAMLGGGSARWKGSMDGKPVVIPQGGQMLSTYIAGLTANPTEADKNAAIDKAEEIANAVYVTGNYSNTHGGGILCNGYLLFGANRERRIVIGDQIVIDGSKVLLDGASFESIPIAKGAFKFTVKDKKGNIVSRGENLESNELVFDRMLPLADEGTFVYTIQEDADNIPEGIAMEGAEYRLTVTTEKSVVQKKDKNDQTIFSVDFIRIKNLLVEQIIDGKTTVLADGEVQTGDGSAYHINVFFNNYQTYHGELTVVKDWKGGGDDPDSVVVRLKRGGALIGEPQELSSQNGWTYTWTDLEIGDEPYVVEEDTPYGYTLTQTVQVKSVAKNYWIPAASGLEIGRQYLITSRDGGYALRIKPGAADAALSSESKAAVKKGEEPLRFGGVDYTDWYSADQTDVNSIFMPKNYEGKGIKLQNVATSAYMLAQDKDDNYLKTASTNPTYGSFFSFDGNVLAASDGWEGNAIRPVVYDAENGKFTTRESDEKGEGVKLYMLVRDPVTSKILVTLTNTFDPTKAVIDLPQTGDDSRIFMWMSLLTGALTVIAGVNRKGRRTLKN